MNLKGWAWIIEFLVVFLYFLNWREKRWQITNWSRVQLASFLRLLRILENENKVACLTSFKVKMAKPCTFAIFVMFFFRFIYLLTTVFHTSDLLAQTKITATPFQFNVIKNCIRFDNTLHSFSTWRERKKHKKLN